MELLSRPLNILSGIQRKFLHLLWSLPLLVPSIFFFFIIVFGHPWQQGLDKDLGINSLCGSWSLGSRNEGWDKWDREGRNANIMCIMEITSMGDRAWILPEPFHVPKKHGESCPKRSSWRDRGEKYNHELSFPIGCKLLIIKSSRLG